MGSTDNEVSQAIEPILFEMDAYRLLVQANALTPDLDAALLRIAATHLWQHLVYFKYVREGQVITHLSGAEVTALMQRTLPREGWTDLARLPMPASLSGWDTFVLEPGAYAATTAFVDAALETLLAAPEEVPYG